MRTRLLRKRRGWMAMTIILLLSVTISVQPILTLASNHKPLPRVRPTQQPRSDNARKVSPVPPERGVPGGLNLPNLDEIHHRQRQAPEAPAPIESPMRSRRKAGSSSQRAGGGDRRSHHARSRAVVVANSKSLRRSALAATPSLAPQSGPPSFTDDPLNPPGQPKTDIKAVHITELRYWIDALRNRRGLSNYLWVKPTASGGAINNTLQISWEPIDEMRTALNQAVGPPANGYAQGLGLNQLILAAHIQELRDRVKGEWGSSLADQLLPARIDPFNQSGNQIEARDCEWGIPLISLPGRAGLDLSIGISYSSMVWTLTGSYISFDDDRGDPSPGFKIGFPTIQGRYTDNQVGVNVYLLITSAGRRVELRRVGTSNIYEAGDSSYLQLIESGNSLLLRTTDGTQMSYTRTGSDFHCTGIEDRNGNVINASYIGDDLSTVTDTLGRLFTFNYDVNTNIQSITETWTVNGAPQTHTWATFGWVDPATGAGPLTLHPGFSGTVVGAYDGESIPVLRQVGLADGSHYNFEYTDRGQVSVIRHYAADGGPGTADDFQLSYLAYNYESPADDCPRVSAARVWASNWTGINGVPAEVVTAFADNHDGTHQMTSPDGTVYKELYGNGWQHGLVTSSQVITGSIVQKSTTTTYDQDNTSVSYYTNPRVIETNISDGTNNRRSTVDYSVAAYRQYGLPYYVSEYAANGTEMRRTYTDYNLGSEYVNLRIIGLVSAVHLVDVTNGWQPKAKTSYAYDSTPIDSQATWAVQHDASYDQSYNSSLHKRGNVTSVSRWDVNNIDTVSTTTTMSYNAAGSRLSTTDPAQHTTTVSYSDLFSNDGTTPFTPHDALGNTITTFAYPTTMTDADGFSSSIWYNYNFGAKMRAQTPLPNVTTNQPGPVTTFSYDEGTRLKQVTTVATGAYVHYEYGPDYTSTFASVNSVAPNYWQSDSYTNQFFDGLGRVFAVASNHPGSRGGNKAQYTRYDQMGRVAQQSNPFEMDSGWNPTGDDQSGYQFNVANTFDWKGRPLKVYNMDGTFKEASYAGCGCAGGEVVTLTDEVGRQQKVYSDSLGRQWKTEVLTYPDPNNNNTRSVYSTTVNVLNARDQVTVANQYAGTPPGDASSINEGVACPSGTCQKITMSYDGYGRLQSKHVPEQQDPSGNPTYTTWSYNGDDTINSVTDARGASATYVYNNNRHLVNEIHYSAPSPITPTSNVTFGYDAAGNRTSMTDGAGTSSYAYDPLSRMSSETRSFVGLSGDYTLSYQYNVANEVTLISLPFSSQQIGYVYDNAGRLSDVTGSGFSASYTVWPNTYTQPVTSFASNIAYRAWGGVKSMSYGNNVSESTSYKSRLQPTGYTVNNVNYSLGGNSTITSMGWTYDYYADGRPQFAHDLTENKWDRSFAYDHVARLREADTNSKARGQAASSFDPYNQTMSYDVWGNITGRLGSLYTGTVALNDNASYTNNRRSGWSYDADGNTVLDTSYQHAFDAAGQHQQATSRINVGDGTAQFPMQPNLEITESYDGDGAARKRVQIGRMNDNDPNDGHLVQVLDETITSYYVRSTVLGGATIADLGTGEVNVYANGERIAKATGGDVKFNHHNPATGGWLETNGHPSSRSTTRQERDPRNAEIPLTNPYPTGSYISMKWDQPLLIEGGDPFDPSSGYEIDGMPVSEAEFNRQAEAGMLNSTIPGYSMNGKGGVPHPATKTVISYGLGMLGVYLPDGARGNDNSWHLNLFGPILIRGRPTRARKWANQEWQI